MIYGQSGGGSKVTTLMGMPSAAGLFHRASAQSGGGGNIPSKEQQTELARQVMKDLGLAAERHRIAAEDGVGEAVRRRQCGGCQDQSAGTAHDGTGSSGQTARGLVAVR